MAAKRCTLCPEPQRRISRALHSPFTTCTLLCMLSPPLQKPIFKLRCSSRPSQWKEGNLPAGDTPHLPHPPRTPSNTSFWLLYCGQHTLKKKKSLWEKALQSPRRTELPNPETTFQWLSPGTWDNHLLERRCPGPLLPAVEGGEAVFPVTGPPPGAAGERRGTRISTPTAPGAQTESRGPRLRRDAPLSLPSAGPPGERGSIAAAMRPGARLTAGPLLPPPGPGRPKFLSRSRRPRLTGRLALGRRAAGESGAAETGAGAGTCYPGRETKKKKPSEDQRGATGLVFPRESAAGAGSRSRGRPAPRLPEAKGAPAPLARRGAEDSRGGAWAPPARPLRGVSAPPAPQRGSRAGAPREEAAQRRQDREGGNAAPGAGRPPRLIPPVAMAPVPVAVAARPFCRSASAARRQPLSPPSRPPARRTPPPETGSAREAARVPPGSARRSPAPAGRRTRLP